MTVGRTPFGRGFQVSGVSRRFGLGALTTAEYLELTTPAERTVLVLDSISMRLGDAAMLGADRATLQSYRDQYDALVNAHERLTQHDRVMALEPADVPDWVAERDRLHVQALALSEQLRAGVATHVGAERWGVGLWTAGLVLGAVGVGFLIRWWAQRRRQRRGGGVRGARGLGVIELQRVRLNRGGYEYGKYGQYYGVGAPVYEWFDTETGRGSSFRASSRKEARAKLREMFPKEKIAR